MIQPQIYTRIPECDQGLLAEAAQIGVADLHEGLGAVVGRSLLMSAAMRPLDPSRRIAGPAVTGYNFPGDNLASHQALYQARAGQVLVLTNGGEVQGAQFGDLNNDGNQDLFLTNGYVSQAKEKSYWYDFSKVAG